MFKRADLEGGLYSIHSGKELFLVAYSAGMMGRGQSLGYVYCGDDVPVAAISFPPCVERSGRSTTDHYQFEKIEERWYIFEEH